MSNMWMKPADEPVNSYIAVYRCRFSLREAADISFRYSADEKAQLFLDGKRIQEGPERGAREYWYYQEGLIKACPGEHVLTVRVICFGFQKWAYAQHSIRHGFFIEEKSGILKDWDCQIESGCSFEAGFPDWGVFPRIHLTAEHNNEILSGKGGVWKPVAWFEDDRVLNLPDLPAMKYEKILPDKQENGLCYFEHYVCAWAIYRMSGKGTVKIRWAESPYLTDEFDDSLLKGKKGKRDGSVFIGNFDIFEVDGELLWYDYWWRAGHYVQIITEGDITCEPEFFRTGYPYPEVKANSKLEEMALETLFNCSHETYMDCPYYEQLMYISDSRLEALCTYSITDDHRLPAKALRMFSLSQRPDGSFNSQWPSHSVQTIPTFMLIWFLMLHDYYERHGNDPLVQEVRPRGEKLLDFLLSQRNSHGLLEMEGWNFIDWYPPWKSGVPPCESCTSSLNWFFVLALQAMAKMQFRPGLEEIAEQVKAKIKELFYVPEQQLYAMDMKKEIFSEHSQVLALLADQDTRVIDSLRNKELIPCSISFSYYYLEACRKFGLDDLLKKRIGKWEALQDEGLTTYPEEFINPRSDCHAWSSHVMLFANEK